VSAWALPACRSTTPRHSRLRLVLHREAAEHSSLRFPLSYKASNLEDRHLPVPRALVSSRKRPSTSPLDPPPPPGRRTDPAGRSDRQIHSSEQSRSSKQSPLERSLALQRIKPEEPAAGEPAKPAERSSRKRPHISHD
jgi:hypothetical protein